MPMTNLSKLLGQGHIFTSVTNGKELNLNSLFRVNNLYKSNHYNVFHVLFGVTGFILIIL